MRSTVATFLNLDIATVRFGSGVLQSFQRFCRTEFIRRIQRACTRRGLRGFVYFAWHYPDKKEKSTKKHRFSVNLSGFVKVFPFSSLTFPRENSTI